MTDRVAGLVDRWRARAFSLREFSPSSAHELELVAAELELPLDAKAGSVVAAAFDLADRLAGVDKAR